MYIDNDHEVAVFDHAYRLGFRAGQLDGKRRSLAAIMFAEASSSGVNIAITRGNISLEEYARLIYEGEE